MKHLYITLMALLVSASAHAEKKTYLRGDVNGDGKVTLLDLSALVSKLVGKEPDKYIAQTADVDGNGTVNINDAKLLTEIILQQKETTSVEVYENVDGTGLGTNTHK